MSTSDVNIPSQPVTNTQSSGPPTIPSPSPGKQIPKISPFDFYEFFGAFVTLFLTFILGLVIFRVFYALIKLL